MARNKRPAAAGRFSIPPSPSVKSIIVRNQSAVIEPIDAAGRTQVRVIATAEISPAYGLKSQMAGIRMVNAFLMKEPTISVEEADRRMREGKARVEKGTVVY